MRRKLVLLQDPTGIPFVDAGDIIAIYAAVVSTSTGLVAWYAANRAPRAQIEFRRIEFAAGEQSCSISAIATNRSPREAVLVAATARVLVTGGSVGRHGRHERTMRVFGEDGTRYEITEGGHGQGTPYRWRVVGPDGTITESDEDAPAIPGSGWQCRK